MRRIVLQKSPKHAPRLSNFLTSRSMFWGFLQDNSSHCQEQVQAVYDSRVLLSFMRSATPSTMVVICWTQLEPTRALFETSKVLPAVLAASPRVPRMSII